LLRNKDIALLMRDPRAGVKAFAWNTTPSSSLLFRPYLTLSRPAPLPRQLSELYVVN
jgi:hypothetical protein